MSKDYFANITEALSKYGWSFTMWEDNKGSFYGAVYYPEYIEKIKDISLDDSNEDFEEFLMSNTFLPITHTRDIIDVMFNLELKLRKIFMNAELKDTTEKIFNEIIHENYIRKVV